MLVILLCFFVSFTVIASDSARESKIRKAVEIDSGSTFQVSWAMIKHYNEFIDQVKPLTGSDLEKITFSQVKYFDFSWKNESSVKSTITKYYNVCEKYLNPKSNVCVLYSLWITGNYLQSHNYLSDIDYKNQFLTDINVTDANGKIIHHLWLTTSCSNFKMKFVHSFGASAKVCYKGSHKIE